MLSGARDSGWKRVGILPYDNTVLPAWPHCIIRATLYHPRKWMGRVEWESNLRPALAGAGWQAGRRS